MKPTHLVFDLNGTLLDLAALDPYFTRIFGNPLARERWFDLFQIAWMTHSLTSDFQPFAKLAEAAITMLAAREQVVAKPADVKAVLNGLRTLPPYPEVADALRQLQQAGFKIVALTNGALSSAQAQLKNAGLDAYFDHVFSVEGAGKYKPAEVAYDIVRVKLAVAPASLMMVAAHHWDLCGAKHCGWQTTFITRPRQVLCPLGAQPDGVAVDLTEFARQMLH